MTTARAAAENSKDAVGPAAYGDEDLITACLKGDQAAWGELIDRYGRLVYTVPRRYGLSEEDAEDVFQEVFAIAYRKLHTIRDSSRLSFWLVTVAHRESCRIGKHSGRYVLSPLDAVEADDEAPPADRAAVWERQHRVRQALRQLGGSCEQLMVALFSAPGRPDYRRIACQLGMKSGSIGPTRTRCFKALERLLADLEPDLAQLP